MGFDEEIKMNYQTFRELMAGKISPGMVFDNPGGGTTIIKGNANNKIAYKRCSSTMYLGIDDMFYAYEKFVGTEVSTSQLKEFKPKAFDSNKSGHNCNCTTFFLIMVEVGLADTIKGKGVRGNPFWVKLN